MFNKYNSGLNQNAFKYSLSMLLALLLVCAPLAQVAPFAPQSAQAESNVESEQQRMQEVYETILQYHLSTPSAEQLTDAAIRGMIESLNDPYTTYMTQEEYEAFFNQIEGSYSGVGMRVEEKDGQVVVLSTFDGSPAQKAGVKTNDMIIRVNGEDVIGLTVEELVTKIKGPNGSKVSITVLRGKQELTFDMVRAQISIPLIESKLLESGVGYIQVMSFGGEVHQTFAQHLDNLEQMDMNGLIIDLRGNPGGLLHSSLLMSELFIPSGNTLLHVKNNSGQQDTYLSEGAGYDKPVVILVDGGSASASEVFTGALRDNGIAKVVGTRSFGKGLVQQIIPLQSGGVIKLTVQEYFTPNMTKINGIGINPDITVDDPEQQLLVAEAMLSGNSQLQLQKDGKVALNGQTLISTVPPAILQNGEWFVSPRAVAALYGGKVTWNAETKTIEMSFSGKNSSFAAADKNVIIHNGTSYIRLSVVLQNFPQLKNNVQVK